MPQLRGAYGTLWGSVIVHRACGEQMDLPKNVMNEHLACGFRQIPEEVGIIHAQHFPCIRPPGNSVYEVALEPPLCTLPPIGNS